MATNTQFPAYNGSAQIPAYVARPAGKPKAAIIVIPEIFGVNPGIQQKCETWASEGYLALAPDIFWRFAPGIELDPDVPEQLQEAFDYFGQYDPDLGVQDIEAAIRHLRGAESVSKVGLVGYCLGGRMAYMAAARTDIDASVGYYGVMIDQMLGGPLCRPGSTGRDPCRARRSPQGDAARLRRTGPWLCRRNG